MLYVFIACLTVGIAYAAASAILGNFDLDHGGVDVDGGIDSADVPSPFSPLVIAGAVTTFGAAGLIGKLGFGLNDPVSLVVSLGFAGIIGTALFFGVVKMLYGSQSNSAFSQMDLAEVDGEVLTPIPAKGVGEIAYIIHGIRYTITAKSAFGEPLARAEKVKIREVIDNIAMVTRKITAENIDSLQEDGTFLKDERINE